MPASRITISTDDFEIVVRNPQAIVDILEIAIGEQPPSLAAIVAQTQQVLKQAHSINTAAPKPAVNETAKE